MVSSQSVRQSLTLYQHGSNTQQMLYVLQMPPAAISHLYSPCSECGIAGTYHLGHRRWCGSHASPAAHWKQMMSKKGLLHSWTPSAAVPAGAGAWWTPVFHSEKNQWLLVLSLYSACTHLSHVKWTASSHVRDKWLNPIKRDWIKDLFFFSLPEVTCRICFPRYNNF